MYLIAGASGNTGSVAARALLAAKKPVRVIVRDSDKAKDWERQGAEVALGTLQDPDFLSGALRGAEAAYLLIPPSVTSGDMRRYLHELADILRRAVEESGVRRVVLLSSIGAQHGSGTGPIDALAYLERRLQEIAGLRLTALRPSYFMENWASMLTPMIQQGVLPAMFRPELAIPMIATADIGRFAAEALLSSPEASEVRQLAGPREYSHQDVAQIAGRLLDKPIQLLAVPAQARLAALTSAGLPADVAAEYDALNGALDSGRIAFEERYPVQRGATTLEQVLGALLKR